MIDMKGEEMVKWLVEVVHYPIDFRVEPPVPESWREDIVTAWYWYDHFGPEGEPMNAESLEDCRRMCAEEGGWTCLPVVSSPVTLTRETLDELRYQVAQKHFASDKALEPVPSWEAMGQLIDAILDSPAPVPLDRPNDPEEIEIGEVIDYNRRLLGEIAQMQRGIERARLMAWVLYEKTGGEDLSDIHNALAMLKRDDFSAPLDRPNEEGR
jgi:hypothetical protein